MEHLKISGNELFLWRKSLLAKGGRSVDLDWLLDIGGGLRWSSLQKLYLKPNSEVLLEKPLEKLSQIWMKHLDEHVPLQYLLGLSPWRDFELEVNSAVMIPRQETELLVDYALSKINEKVFGAWVDLGTGSGALAIALAKALPLWDGYAVELSQEAICVAKSNILRLLPNKSVDLFLGKWWEPLEPLWGSFDLVVSNPPYIPDCLIEGLQPEVRLHEPLLALSGGSDGLKSLREVISGSIRGLKRGGWILIEHHYDQSNSVMELMKNIGLVSIEFKTDLEGVKRFALGQNP